MRAADELTLSASDVVAMCLAAELERVGADAGYIGTPTRSDMVEVARVTPFSSRPVRLVFAADAPYPLVEALRTGSPIFIGSNAELACDHPGLVRAVADDHACATMPLTAADGTVLGSLNLGFEEPHEFTEAERAEIERIAARCSTALADALAQRG
jgi:transcriptional regulator with GAF, ATPase, and Fis domain